MAADRIQYSDFKHGRPLAEPWFPLRRRRRLAVVEAYDLNPVPVDVMPRVLTTAIDDADGTTSLELALSVVGYFDVGDAKARKIAREVGRSVTRWRFLARKAGIKEAEIDRMASVFEHNDLQNAVKGPQEN